MKRTSTPLAKGIRPAKRGERGEEPALAHAKQAQKKVPQQHPGPHPTQAKKNQPEKKGQEGLGSKKKGSQ